MENSFVQSALVLMAAAALNRIIGFIYQASIYRLIGAEGVGLFNLVYPVYILITVVATAGIPLGISKLVSEEQAKGNHRAIFHIFWLSFSILVVSGAVFSIGTYLISPWLQKFVFSNKMVFPVFLCMIPGIFIVSISSALRGFFQGLMNMRPPAFAQVVEQITRVLIGIILATQLLPKGIQRASVGVASASIIGELIGLLVLAAVFFITKSSYIHYALPDLNTSVVIFKKLFYLCTPITLGRIASTVMLTADSLLIPYILKRSGYTIAETTALYGQLTSVALTLLFIPSVITVSLATSLVPAISEALAQNKLSVVSIRTRNAIRLTILSGVPFISAFISIPDKITKTIYGASDIGNLLSILALGGIFAYLQQTTTGILQGMGLPAIPLKNSLWSGAVKITCMSMLGMLGFGIKGIAYSYIVFFILTAVLNLTSISCRVAILPKITDDFIKPVFAGLISFFLMRFFYNEIMLLTGFNSLSTIAALVLGFSSYIAMVLISGSLTRQDLNRFPLIKDFFR